MTAAAARAPLPFGLGRDAACDPSRCVSPGVALPRAGDALYDQVAKALQQLFVTFFSTALRYLGVSEILDWLEDNKTIDAWILAGLERGRLPRDVASDANVDVGKHAIASVIKTALSQENDAWATSLREVGFSSGMSMAFEGIVSQLKPSKGTLPCLHSLLTPAGLSLLKSAPLKHAFPVSPPRTPPSPSPLLASVRDMITRGTLSGPEWDHTPSWRPHVRRAYTRYHAAVKDVAEEIVSASEFAREYHIFLESIAQPVQLFQLIMDDFENEFGPGATKGLLGVGQVGGPNLIQIMDFCAAKRASELLARVKDKVREKQEKDKKRRTLDDKQKRLDEIHAAERQLSAALDILVRNARGELGHSCDDCQHHLHDAYPNLLDPSQMTKTVKEVERKCELLQAEARKLERDIKAFTDEIIADNVKAVNGGPPAQKLKPASAESPRPATPAEDRPYFERPVGCSRDLSLRQQMEDPFSSIARRQARPCMQPSASAKSRGKAPAAPRVTQTNQALANSKGSTTLMQIEGLTTLDPKTGKLHTTTTSKTVPAPRQPSSKVTLPPASVPKQSVPAPPPAAVLAPEAPTHATIEAEEVLATEDVKEAAPAATEAPASTHTEETLAEEAIVEDADETLVDDPPEEELPPIVESAQAQKEPEPVESKHVNGHTNLTAPGMNSRSVSAATTVDSVAMQAQVDADQSTAPKKHKKHKKKKQGASKVAEAPVVANGTPSKLHGISAVAPDGLRLYTVEVALNRGRKWRPLREQVTEGVRKMLQAMPLLKTCSTAWCTREWTATPAAEPTTAWAQLDKLLLETFIAAFKYELIGNLVLPLSFVRDVVAKDYLLGGGRMTEASDNRTPRDVVPFLEAVEHTMWRTGTTFRVQFLLLETLTIAMQKLCDILRAQLGPDLCLCRVAKHPDVLVHAGTRLSQGEIADRSVPVDLPCMDQQAFIKWCHKQLRDKQLAGAEWEGVERSYRVADYLYTFANAFDASLDRMMAKDPYTIAEDVFTLMEWHGGLRLFDLAMRLGREPPSLSDDIPDERAGWTLKTRVPGWATVLDLAQDARPEDRQIETTLWEDERKQGNVHFSQGEHDKSLACYQAASILCPTDVLSWTNAAAAQIKLGTRPSTAYACQLSAAAEAAADSTVALALDPGNAKALYRRGVGLAKLGKWKAATADLEELARLAPDDEPVRQVLEAVKRHAR